MKNMRTAKPQALRSKKAVNNLRRRVAKLTTFDEVWALRSQLLDAGVLCCEDDMPFTTRLPDHRRQWSRSVMDYLDWYLQGAANNDDEDREDSYWDNKPLSIWCDRIVAELEADGDDKGRLLSEELALLYWMPFQMWAAHPGCGQHYMAPTTMEGCDGWTSVWDKTNGATAKTDFVEMYRRIFKAAITNYLTWNPF